MRNIALTLFFLMVLIMTFTALGIKDPTPIVPVNPNEIKIYSETFGEFGKPTVLLNAGAGQQAIHWPIEFCNQLAERGYYVIRYDYRDAGLSTAVDFEQYPYNVMDLVFDTQNILDKYGIAKAHYVGFSMGGELSQVAAAFHPRRVNSITLIGTSTDFKPGFDAFEGKYNDKGLPPPTKEYIEWATRKVDFDNQALEEKVNDYVHTWRLLDGSPENFAEDFFKKQGEETFTRTKLLQPYTNHAKCMKLSYELHELSPEMIKIPALILHGSKDPVFPVPHAHALSKKIAGSKLVVINEFAHAISPQNFDRLVDEIDSFLKTQSK